MIKDILSDESPENSLEALLNKLHREGPTKSVDLEKLAYYKKFHAQVFGEYEESFLSALGLFYKIEKPENFLSLVLSRFGSQYEEEFGRKLTPVQASIRYALEEYRAISISAPTSAGKSFSIKDYIVSELSNAVIIVPSRALVDEYLQSLQTIFGFNKGVLVSAFVDEVFTSRDLTRIFVLTPERARELFAKSYDFSIDTFFFDEAQISEDLSRGVLFDVLLRQIKQSFPDAKLIFAHPFVLNPEAQITKHQLESYSSFSKAYTHGAVGRICVQKHNNNKSYYFSPNVENGHRVSECIEFDGSFEEFAFDGTKTVLIYTSKTGLYSGSYKKDYKRYIERYEILEDVEALELVELVEEKIGARQQEHYSDLVELMRRGVVIHHGSVPLDVRFIIEDFVKKGFGKLCFATSTLSQGVNMPFDVVWLDKMRIMGDNENERALSFKNLIGRAGRLTERKKFDYGYVFTKNAKLFLQRMNGDFVLNEESFVTNESMIVEEELKELVKSIKDGSFDDDVYAPQSRVSRLTQSSLLNTYSEVLAKIYADDQIASENIKKLTTKDRLRLIYLLKDIYEAFIGRNLYDGERAVFEQALIIYMNILQGSSFKDVVRKRYAYIANLSTARSGLCKFSQEAAHLPNASLTSTYPLFESGTKARDVSYDTIVYDTYDYIDRVLSFSINEKLSIAFRAYRSVTGDPKADKFVELLRFGTNDTTYTLLLRYGFSADIIEELIKYISFINETEIGFQNLSSAPEHILEAIRWYLP